MSVDIYAAKSGEMKVMACLYCYEGDPAEMRANCPCCGGKGEALQEDRRSFGDLNWSNGNAARVLEAAGVVALEGNSPYEGSVPAEEIPAAILRADAAVATASARMNWDLLSRLESLRSLMYFAKDEGCGIGYC